MNKMKMALVAAIATCFCIKPIFAETPAGKPTGKPMEYCEVTICNRIERFSLNPFSHMKDSAGEVCQNSTIPKSEAVVGKELSSESRWWQGSSINPTKKSVTRVKQVNSCGIIVMRK